MRLFKKMWRLLRWSLVVGVGFLFLAGIFEMMHNVSRDRVVIRFGDQTHVYAYDRLPEEIVIERFSLQEIPAVPPIPTIPPVPTIPPIPTIPPVPTIPPIPTIPPVPPVPEIRFEPPAPPPHAEHLPHSPVMIIETGSDLSAIMGRLGNIIGSLALIGLGVVILRRERGEISAAEKSPDDIK